MLRKIILIDEDKCTGCGDCVPNCAEGALQIIDGKARLISDLFCDGLGACIGKCPESAITIVEREAEAYDERKVMDNVVKGGMNVIKAHLEHMRDHKEFEYLTEALDYLEEKGIENPLLISEKPTEHIAFSGCPGSQTREIKPEPGIINETDTVMQKSQLRQWPIQLHLVSPFAPYFKDSDLLLCADCAGIAYPNLHSEFLEGKSLAIACPKLDTNKQVYLEKLIAMIDSSEIKSISVLIMEVPCCGGLYALAEQAVEHAERKIPVNRITIMINGQVRKG
jgi:ferredoxin